MLTDTDRATLDLEAQRWKYAGAKEAAIRDRFDMTTVRYYQVLNVLIDRTEALAYAPLTVKKLLRLRDARKAQRTKPEPGDRSDANQTSRRA